MTVQISIIGLGQIGASIGLALAEHKDKVTRVGHDREIGIARQAEKLGAIDKAEFNLPNAVEKAGVVILALPVDQIKETLSIIAPVLKEDVVVLDTAPLKEAVIGWVNDILPERCHYVGLIPVINPEYLIDAETGIAAARADLFHHALFGVVSVSHAASEAVKLATDLTGLLGAEHLFFDPVEVDSLMAAIHILPMLTASALLSITVDQPGWFEGRKLAGRAYAEGISPLHLISSTSGLVENSLLTSKHVTRVLDNLMVTLQQIRQEIQDSEPEKLIQRLETASAGRERWLKERQAADWSTQETAPSVELPSTKDFFSRMFGFRKPKPLPGEEKRK